MVATWSRSGAATSGLCRESGASEPLADLSHSLWRCWSGVAAAEADPTGQVARGVEAAAEETCGKSRRELEQVTMASGC